MLLRISSEGKKVIDKESLQSLGKLEKDLEDWMAENLDSLLEGYELYPIHKESPAKSEADIIALDDQASTFIFELKRGQADHRAVGQLFNYWTKVAKMKYDELEQAARKYHGKQDLKLYWEHYKNFNPKKRVEEQEFNQKSHLIVVAESANEELWDMITFLRSRFEIPLAFIKFDVYHLEDGELLLYFDTSDAIQLLDKLSGEEEVRAEELYEDKERYFWYNTNKKHLEPPDLHDKVFNMSIAATYGPNTYGEKLAEAKKGDHVFAYANGEGIRAYGKVTQKWNGNAVGKEEKAVTRDRPEYHLPVNWEIVFTKEEAIRSDEIRALGYNDFRGTFRRIRYTEFARNLKKEMDFRNKK